MLSADVWKLKCKETKKNVRTHDGFIKCDVDRIPNLINSHFFNHSISFTLAGVDNIPEELMQILDTDSDYYMIRDIPVFEFFESTFINYFVRKGELTALDNGNSLLGDNGFAIDPKGHLMLRLTEDCYTSLGIEGKRKNLWGNPYYVIDLNLNKSEIMTGKLNARYHKCLKNSELKFDVLVLWEPFDTTICPSSIAFYFHKKSYNVSLCNSKQFSHYKFDSILKSPFDDEQEEFLIWFGCHLFDVREKLRGVFNHLNGRENPINLITYKWVGFFSYRKVLQLWYSIKKLIESSESDNFWICMYVSGFKKLNLFEDQIMKNYDDYFTVFLNRKCCITYPSRTIPKS